MSNELFDLEGEVVVVTGGTRGIGLAIAQAFADAGAAVVPTSRSEEAVDAAVEDVRNRGADSLASPVDVADEDDITKLFDRVESELGGADIVVNNAGFNPDDALGKPEDISADAFDSVMDVNLRGAFLCSKHAAERLHESGGSVINIASVGGMVGLPRQHPYVASKHGLVGLTRSLALDWAPTVRVNAVAPGYVSTDLTEGLEANDRLRQSIIDRTPIDRFAEPEEIAAPVLFLASDAASFVTGSCLTVDGGWTAQ
ncbi:MULTISPECIES: SDR family oxidoreductase [unclassified Haladaptatus]|uniref:SDR family NAD(P)-dependent oxidoreductase n=1 Tax=unclassified Haladaptatus TaxID=2622732 RepID=UPI00209C0CEB|nr:MULTISPECIES: SDR family oxidoreductase [unclassified Haladaptatus]MCO8246722.1 SDR family oxidoreductase [Haladaptatus sp. AB643]MCO8256370.1 SDR family oxidoreductase [Haladaptatus sp. AB618]